MARYNPTLGIFGNLKALFSEDAKNKNQINTNKAQADAEMLEIQANQVEAVIDEFLTVVGEEREQNV